MTLSITGTGDGTGDLRLGDLHPNADSGRTSTEHARISGIGRIAKHAEDVGLDVYALGEHHNPPFIPSSPTTILGYVAAKTERILLSTSDRRRPGQFPTLISTPWPKQSRTADEALRVRMRITKKFDVQSSETGSPAFA
jgi:Luciferase-like monooxygenase